MSEKPTSKFRTPKKTKILYVNKQFTLFYTLRLRKMIRKYTGHPGKLIKTRTEPSRNKQVFSEYL